MASKSSDIKSLGRKARERLEEERGKRREIVRLNEEPPAASGTTTILKFGLGAISQTKRQQRQPVATKRPGAPPPIRKTVKRSRATKDQNIASLTPDTSQILTVEEELRSSLVRLHGVPSTVRPEDIRRFFSGLEPDRIVVLPGFDEVIPKWDATFEPTYSTRNNRRESDGMAELDLKVRVFVKFESAPVAHLATQRSGEVLSLQGAAGERLCSCIAVTHICKTSAALLLQRMSIDGENGVAFRETLVRVENNLPDIVTSILWASIVFDLKLQTKNSTGIFQFRIENNVNPLELEGYQILASHHNKLADHYESLVGPSDLSPTFDYNSELSRDPVIRLTCQAAYILLAEMRRIQQILLVARFEGRMRHEELVPDRESLL